MKLTGAQIFLESLVREGVKHIFGHPGGVVLTIYDELPKFPLKHFLVRHEQGGVHMADGYARATGKAGVVLVTSGPGATNTVTGLATAYMDSIPVVCFTGQVPTHLVGNDAFQEADIVGISRPCTKHNYLVKDVNDLARIVREAFYIATTGRPGPVLVDLPKDVINAQTEFHWPEKVHLRSYNPTYQGHPGQVAKAVDLILQSRKPVIYVGGGAILSNASPELVSFATKLGTPVAPTLMALGAFPMTHWQCTGMLGMHGEYQANMAMHDADLLIAIGPRFDDRVTGKLDEFAPCAKKIHLDIDPTSIGKNIRADVPIVGDAREVLRQMMAELDGRPQELEEFKANIQEWWAQVRKWREEHPLSYDRTSPNIKPQYVIEKLYELTGGDAIVSTGVGQHQMWAAQFWKFDRPRTFLTSGGLGTMGYGFPAAVGAQVAFPDRLVIDIDGDGSFQMTCQDLILAAEHNLPVKVAIINNGYIGMVRQWQEFFFRRNYSQSDMACQPDFVKLAEAYRCAGLRATKPDEMVGVIKEALATPGPVVMDFQVEREENCFPMIPAGGAHHQMILPEVMPS
ncbi:MAG: biosynthetic-type acetolactate synthase large subunit [Deltaproteobacteria bacterium]|nr:biosynthetic-type acetolactate synthase large subunit [Deltaproteobacteria bacterium]